MMRKSSQLLD